MTRKAANKVLTGDYVDEHGLVKAVISLDNGTQMFVFNNNTTAFFVSTEMVNMGAAPVAPVRKAPAKKAPAKKAPAKKMPTPPKRTGRK